MFSLLAQSAAKQHPSANNKQLLSTKMLPVSSTQAKGPEDSKAQLRQKKKKKKMKGGGPSRDQNQMFRRAVKFLAKQIRLEKDGASTLLSKDIPYNRSVFFKGTQAPTIRVYLTTTTVTGNSGGHVVTVYNIGTGTVINWSDFSAVFDEYRPIRGEIYYQCATDVETSNEDDFAVGVIDYDETAALSSFDQGSDYDTRKFFFLLGIKPNKTEAQPCLWPVEFEPLPDQTWLDTKAGSTTFASWKVYDANPVGGTPNIGHVGGWLDIQFRGGG